MMMPSSSSWVSMTLASLGSFSLNWAPRTVGEICRRRCATTRHLGPADVDERCHVPVDVAGLEYVLVDQRDVLHTSAYEQLAEDRPERFNTDDHDVAVSHCARQSSASLQAIAGPNCP